ncbi:hypothetical protein F5B19DRAFT_415304 [Rostrohypoxylon terebratum]|nr:hypothetical protein F5B19DRAFT_415304 [Rostrohypoxylon terebratum]
MCYDWHQEYTECCHFSKKRIHCPTYHKQQSTAKTFLGRLLFGNVKNRKDCGRVIPHYPEPRPFCPECTVVVDQLRAKHVGEGAFKVFRPNLDSEICLPCEELHEKCRPVARPTPHTPRSERYVDKYRNNYGNIAMHTTHNVWIPDLYRDPEMLAREMCDCQAVQSTPPEGTPRLDKPSAARPSPRKPMKEGEKKEKPEQPSKRSCKQSGRSPAGKPSAVQYSQHPQVPPSSLSAHGHHHRHRQQRRKEVGKRLPTPPAPKPPPKLPPKPPPKPQGPRMWCGTEDNCSDQKRHDISRKPLPAVPKTTSSTSLVPPPAYQVYLNALRNPGPNFGEAERPPKPPPKKKKHRRISEELKSSNLRKRMRITPSSPVSDLSFMCQDSRRLTNRASAAERR